MSEKRAVSVSTADLRNLALVQAEYALAMRAQANHVAHVPQLGWTSHRTEPTLSSLVVSPQLVQPCCVQSTSGRSSPTARNLFLPELGTDVSHHPCSHVSQDSARVPVPEETVTSTLDEPGSSIAGIAQC